MRSFGAIRRFRTAIFLTIISLTWTSGLFADSPQFTGTSEAKLDIFLQKEIRETLHTVTPGRGFRDIQPAEIEGISSRRYNVVVHGDTRALDDLNIHVNSRHDGFSTARLTTAELRALAGDSRVQYVEKGSEMSLALDRSLRMTNVNQVHNGVIYNVPYKGNGVIIGVIDTGIDIFHSDFRVPGQRNLSRVLSIWDVSLEPQGNESSPDGFDYGVEYTRDDIQKDLRGETLRAIRSVDPNGHGTHVAGIAGGNGESARGLFTGVAPEAEFVIVAFPSGTFGVAATIDALNYIFDIADKEGKAAVVNMSLGGHATAHDGTSPQEMVINYHTEFPGRAVVAASGNWGALGNHYGSPVAQNSEENFLFRVPEFIPYEDDNHYVYIELWYESDEDIEITLTTPGGSGFTTLSGETTEEQTEEGGIFVEAGYNTPNAKGARGVAILLYKSEEFLPAAGDWNITFRNPSPVSTAEFNAWLVINRIGASQSIVTFQPNTGRLYTVTSPGTAEGAVTVGAFVTRNQWTDKNGNTWVISGNPLVGTLPQFSGGGPTRDKRYKPDVAAPGTAIISAKSSNAEFDAPLQHAESGYAYLTGTSMATPHVTGISALILEANPTLSGRDIIRIIRESATSDGLTSQTPNFEWGYGKVNALAAFDFFEILQGVPDEFYLYQNYPNPFNATTTIRFTIPEPVNGRLAVYDILGREVDVLIDGNMEPRLYTIPYDGSALSSGVYFYSLTTEKFREVNKMLLLK